jgi:hypothetical protein
MLYVMYIHMKHVWRECSLLRMNAVMTLWLPSRLFWLGSQSQSQPLDSVGSRVRVRVDSRMWVSESESINWLLKNGSQSQSQSQITPVMSWYLLLGHKDDNLLRFAEKRLWLFDSRVDSLTLSRQLYQPLWYASIWCALVTLDLLITLGAPQVTRVILVGHIVDMSW